MQLFGYIYVLRTMRHTLVASDTMACLTKFRHATVITDEECATGFGIVFILSVLGHIPFVDATVIMQENSRNIQSVRAHFPIGIVGIGTCILGMSVVY